MSDYISSSLTQSELDSLTASYSLDIDADGQADEVMLEVMASDIKDGVTTYGSVDDMLAVYYYYTDELPTDLLENPSQYADIWTDDAAVGVLQEIRVDNPGTTLAETLASHLTTYSDVEISLVRDIEDFLEYAYTNLDVTELEDAAEITDLSDLLMGGGSIRSVMLMFCIAMAQVTQETESSLMDRFEENLAAQAEMPDVYLNITDSEDDPAAALAETKEADLDTNMLQMELTALTDNMSNVEKMLETMLTFTSEVISSEYRVQSQILANY